MSVFSSPTVQSVAKQSLAAGITGLSVGGFFKLLRHVAGTSTEQAVQSLEPFLEPADREKIVTDRKMLDLMDRMAIFHSMAPEDFKQVLQSSVHLVDSIQTYQTFIAQNKKHGISASFEVRTKAQDWIEQIRLLRGILQLTQPAVLDDFDEIAGDCQNYFDQVNENVLQDAQLLH